MIAGTGIDIVSVSRIETLLKGPFSERFKRKIYDPEELEFIAGRDHPVEMYAAFWAVKEAYMKAVGTGHRQGVYFPDIIVGHEPSGKPYLSLAGKAREKTEELGITAVHVSMSHEREYAVGMVILERNP